MELPDDVLALIRAFSKPLTRPNWRQSKPIISTYQLFLVTIKKIKKIEDSWQFTRYDDLYTNIKGTDWYWSYTNLRDFGLNIYFRHHQYYYGEATTIQHLNRVDGLDDAILQHKYLYGSMYIFK